EVWALAGIDWRLKPRWSWGRFAVSVMPRSITLSRAPRIEPRTRRRPEDARRRSRAQLCQGPPELPGGPQIGGRDSRVDPGQGSEVTQVGEPLLDRGVLLGGIGRVEGRRGRDVGGGTGQG